jgi:hypothetical protein
VITTTLKKHKWKLIPTLIVVAGVCAWALGCIQDKDARSDDAVMISLEWNKFVLDAELNTEGYRGPIAARTYAYIGMAAYESARPGFDGDFRSMASMFNGLILPPAPPDALYSMEIALNSCYTTIIKHFFLSGPETIRNRQKMLAEKWNATLHPGQLDERIRASTAFGKQIADAIYTWSATDTFGFEANHHNYDRTFIPPAGEGYWVPSPDFPMPALLPYWGKIRPFVITVDDFIADSLPPYSTATNDLYHKQAVEIVSFSKPLSSENQWIAEFWHDDRPGLTFSPSGHWLAITNQVIQKEQPAIEKTLSVYLKIGFALADAMIACWKSKYIYNVMRPETYIQTHIDPNWRPYSPSPSFPSYPSGHSMMGAAAAEVLVDEFGSPYAMTDYSHDWLPDYSVEPRKFNSFDDMARENAMSRLFLGVHWRFDCEEGLRLGSLIGKKIAAVEIEDTLPQ